MTPISGKTFIPLNAMPGLTEANVNVMVESFPVEVYTRQKARKHFE
jgi:hypothetical protein